MGILNNGFRDNYGCLRFAGAGMLGGAAPSALASAFHRPGAQRNLVNASEAMADETHSVPDGVRHPYTWIMAQKCARMSARITGMTLDTAATALMGYPISGQIDISITIPNADGQAVASGEGSATLTISCAALTLTSSINGDGTASFAITGGTTTLGALAGIEGTAPIELTGTLDLNAWGLMEGTTEEQGLTPAGIANAVWSAIAAQNNDSGTMGELLNSAGAAADPLLGVVEGTLTLRDVQRIVLSALAGPSERTGNTISFTSPVDGATVRISGSFDAENNRTGVILNGS